MEGFSPFTKTVIAISQIRIIIDVNVIDIVYLVDYTHVWRGLASSLTKGALVLSVPQKIERRRGSF